MAKKPKFTTLTSLHKPRYGDWAGNPRGWAPDPALCCEEVYPPGRAMIPGQCAKSRGHGPEAAYCAVHAPEAVEARRNAAQAAYDAKWEPDRIRSARAQATPSLIAALQAIAAGHNDPRTLATETLATLNPRAFK
jgi:hypothetical protein